MEPSAVARNPEHQSAQDRGDEIAVRVVTLVHGPHRWRFACAPGEERTLVAAAARVAMRGDTTLDLADAAILARRLDAWPAHAKDPNAQNTRDDSHD